MNTKTSAKYAPAQTAFQWDDPFFLMDQLNEDERLIGEAAKSFAGEISEIYAGAAIVEAPTPRPPINLKIANIYGSFAKAEPTAETV